MKLNETSRNCRNTETKDGFKNACVASCRKILAQLARAKETIFAEYHHALKSQERLIRLALNEAEATAWQTMYPHLVFPTLATEKVQTVISWNTRQQSIRRTNPVHKLTA